MTKQDRILIIEDDATIRTGLVTALENERFVVGQAATGEKGLLLAEQEDWDVIISDIMLPGIDGLTVMRKLKESNPGRIIIMLTARDSEIDRVMGLELGADDYVTKPFSIRELIARIKARLRTTQQERQTPDTFSFGTDTRVDLRRRILWKNGQEISLTTHEAGTLNYLIKHRGQDVSRDELLREVWGYSTGLTTRTVDNQILKLRKKIEDTPSQPRHILTIHGTGYRFEA